MNDYFAGLDREALKDAQLRRLNRICNGRKTLKAVKAELRIAEDELAHICALLRGDVIPFPATALAANAVELPAVAKDKRVG